jgi:DNA-binding MarR family transcriptional regulator
MVMDDQDLTSILLDWSTTFVRLSLHDFNRFTRTVGLSLAQMIVLMHLYYRGASEVNTFCGMMQITPAGASQMVERMVQQGIVERKEVPGDRRVRLVALTEKGRQIVVDSIDARRAWVNRLVNNMPVEERERISAALVTLKEYASQLEIHPV